MENIKYMTIRTLQSVHNDVLVGSMRLPGRTHADPTAPIYSGETARNMAAHIAKRSAILLKCDLNKISANVTLEDAKREKALAEAICRAETDKQLNDALADMKEFLFEIRSRAGGISKRG